MLIILRSTVVYSGAHVCMFVCIGLLVSGFLDSQSTPAEYCKTVLQDGCQYDGFSLITASLRLRIIPYTDARTMCLMA